MKKSVVVLLATLSAVLLISACSNTREPGFARGRELYETCVPCHGAAGEGSAALAAPAIAGLPDWYLTEQLTKFKNGVRGAHPEDVEGGRMRPMARTLYKEGDIPSVVEYVVSLPPNKPAQILTGGDATAGQTRYNSVCIACHGPTGEGLEALRAPTLNHQADWYMLAQLKKFNQGLRGTHPDDIYGSQMRAMSLTLEDETAMMDVVAYVRTLSK